VSGGFHGAFARAPQGSASDDAARAPDPLGPPGNSSLPAAVFTSVTARDSAPLADIPRDRDASLFVFANPLPMGLPPQIPLEDCQAPPLPNVCPIVDVCGVLSSWVCLLGGELKSPNLVVRAWRKVVSGV
jgi:hypothetical protein